MTYKVKEEHKKEEIAMLNDLLKKKAIYGYSVSKEGNFFVFTVIIND